MRCGRRSAAEALTTILVATAALNPIVNDSAKLSIYSLAPKIHTSLQTGWWTTPADLWTEDDCDVINTSAGLTATVAVLPFDAAVLPFIWIATTIGSFACAIGKAVPYSCLHHPAFLVSRQLHRFCTTRGVAISPQLNALFVDWC